jgi:hypothetical protein
MKSEECRQTKLLIYYMLNEGETKTTQQTEPR